MTRRRRTCAIALSLAVSAIFVAAAGYLWVISVALGTKCGTELMGSYEAPALPVISAMAPTRPMIILIYLENCGTTTPFATYAIMDIGRRDDRKPEPFFSVQGKNNMQATWDDQGRLMITYDQPDAVHRQAIVWERQTIQYKTRE